MAKRELQRDGAAEGMADDMRWLPNLCDQGMDQVRLDRQVETAMSRPVRCAAVAAEIGREHLVTGTKRVGYDVPLAAGAACAMQEHDRIAAANNRILHRNIADLDFRHGHLRRPVGFRRREACVKMPRVHA